MAERDPQVQELFNVVIKIAPSKRESFLSVACASDVRLRSEIDSMVLAHEQNQDPVNASPYEVAGER